MSRRTAAKANSAAAQRGGYPLSRRAAAKANDTAARRAEVTH